MIQTHAPRGACSGSIEVFKTELQLVVMQPFGAPTKLAALELLNDQPEAFDLGLRLGEVGTFGRQHPDHLLQRLHVVWQIGKIDVHEPEVYPDSRASSSIHMPVSQSAGKQVGTGEAERRACIPEVSSRWVTLQYKRIFNALYRSHDQLVVSLPRW